MRWTPEIFLSPVFHRLLSTTVLAALRQWDEVDAENLPPKAMKNSVQFGSGWFLFRFSKGCRFGHGFSPVGCGFLVRFCSHVLQLFAGWVTRSWLLHRKTSVSSTRHKTSLLMSSHLQHGISLTTYHLRLTSIGSPIMFSALAWNFRFFLAQFGGCK